MTSLVLRAGGSVPESPAIFIHAQTTVGPIGGEIIEVTAAWRAPACVICRRFIERYHVPAHTICDVINLTLICWQGRYLLTQAVFVIRQ